MKINITVNVPNGKPIAEPVGKVIDDVLKLRKRYPDIICGDDVAINVMPENFFNTSLESNVTDFIDEVSKELDGRMSDFKTVSGEETNVH